PVSPYLEDQSIVLRDLSDAPALDADVHLSPRAVQRIDRNDTDGQPFAAIARMEAAALLDGELEPERCLRLERRDVCLRVHELDLARSHDVRGGRLARSGLFERQRHRLGRERSQTDLV